jgi:phosphatidate cytidylyltransferase
MAVRVLSAAVLVALLIVTLWWLPSWATLVLAAIAAALGGAELAALARGVGGPVPVEGPAAAAFLTCVALAVSDTSFSSGLLIVVVVLVAATVGGALMTLATSAPGPAAFAQPAAVVLAATYVGLPLGAAAWIRETAGPAPITWLIALIALSDSAQYYTGRAFGRRKLAPVVSPGKTVEGALGGVAVAAVAGPALAAYWLPGTSTLEAVLLSVILAGFGIAGDLFESLLKRSAGVKDSGTLIPGHGGILDRVDAMLFAMPMFYLYLRVAP